MMIVRDVFHARYGKGGELVALLKEARATWSAGYEIDRIFTDASGDFFTVVSETDVESLADWELRLAHVFTLPEFHDWFSRMTPLVESGRREFYHVEV
ncbi:MAG TPA: hypothetical protein VLC95_10510 [Anaerolineae bacterium]|nr:hypothetical protein [Anaerolineae bacterium]